MEKLPKKPVYLDYNATTPLDPEVIQAIFSCLSEKFGNPSCPHYFGREARTVLEHARSQVAYCLNCQPSEIVFTSGGTESNNYAIAGFALSNRERGNHIITSCIEHPAVTEVCRHLAGKGFDISFLPVDRSGRLDPSTVAEAITEKTILISVMHANNEVGTIQPLPEIAEIAARNSITFHTDAAQSIGKVDADVNLLGVDMLSIAGHKVYGPKGVGALYLRQGLELYPILQGAGQESGIRPGTENIPGIAGLGKACELAKMHLGKNQQHLAAMRDRLEKGLNRRVPDLVITGNFLHRLPNTSNACFKNVDKDFHDKLFKQIAASSGSACHSGERSVSPVLSAMGIPEEIALGAVRFSTGKFTSENEIDTALNIIENLCSKDKKACNKEYI